MREDCRRRLVRGPPHHAHRRDRLFRGAGGGRWLRRHRHERIRSDDDLSWHQGRGGVVESDCVRDPRKNGRPYLLDFSTGVVANGKIMGAADRGEKIPIGWGVDKDGRDTTDPKAVENVLPMAGIKGASLSFMIECLTSLLLSEPRVAPDLESWAIGDDPFLNGSLIAVNIEAFGDPEIFLREAERLGTAISGLDRAEGTDRITLPGERGDAIRAEREKSGIPVPKGTWQRIGKAADKLGVKLPLQ